jgi:hypothetical protein
MKEIKITASPTNLQSSLHFYRFRIVSRIVWTGVQHVWELNPALGVSSSLKDVD